MKFVMGGPKSFIFVQQPLQASKLLRLNREISCYKTEQMNHIHTID